MITKSVRFALVEELLSVHFLCVLRSSYVFVYEKQGNQAPEERGAALPAQPAPELGAQAQPEPGLQQQPEAAYALTS